MARKTNRVVKFSEKSISELVAPLTGRVEWWDDDTPNLLCRVTPAGSKSFYWFGRFAGELQRTFIGKWPQMTAGAARVDAKRLSGQAAIGEKAATRARRSKQEWTLQQLFDWYMDNHSRPTKRTWKWDERNFKVSLSHWAHRRVSSIKRIEVQDLHQKIGKARGPYAANKMLELLGTMYRSGADIDPVGVPCPDPTKRLKRFSEEERERFLDADELPRFLAAVASMRSERARDFLLLALFTGARRNNVLSMRWDELSLKTGMWKIPKDKSKNKTEMNIAISPPAVEILVRRKKVATGPWVLPSFGPTGHFNSPQYAMEAARKLAGLKNVRIHDLRRTLGSWMAVNYPLQTIGKQLGQKSLKSVQIYARLANQALKDAVGATGAVFEGMKPKGEEEPANGK